jgi:hypothetical protein
MRVAGKGIREPGAIMHVGVMILLWLLASSVEAGELPFETDVRAAYCIPIVQNSIDVVRLLMTDPIMTDPEFTESTETITAALAGMTNQLQRLKLYLVPRISPLEPLGLTTAMQRAKEDLAQSEQYGKSCQTKCKQSANKRASAEGACLDECIAEDPVRSRFKDCFDLRWLPS